MIVADASIVANALGDDGADGAAARAVLRTERDLAAPDLVDVETASVLRRRWLNGDLTAQRFRSAITDLGDLDIMRHPTLPFMSRAYELRANVTPYDAAYIGLAEALDCDLVTADARLAKAPGPRCQFRIVRS
ncbi:MAG: type II toxin-antitoxin system VapC family toxin [Acidimicrobiia bacterium]